MGMEVCTYFQKIDSFDNVPRVNKHCNAITSEQIHMKTLQSYTLCFSRQQPTHLLCSQDA